LALLNEALGALRANWLEALAVATGLAYVLLILWRNRLGWVAGAVSSTIYVLIAARARLPMQSVLNAYYVVMSVYGWISWTRNATEQGGRIFRWPLRRHVLAIVLILAVSALSARLLATLARDDWPLLDAVTTWTSFFATWLVARSVLENWCYWIAADLIMVFVYLRQGHVPTAGLFTSYVIVALLGFRSWLRRYGQQQP
jgi:nicotinamide mononucleotide transporter